MTARPQFSERFPPGVWEVCIAILAASPLIPAPIASLSVSTIWGRVAYSVTLIGLGIGHISAKRAEERRQKEDYENTIQELRANHRAASNQASENHGRLLMEFDKLTAFVELFQRANSAVPKNVPGGDKLLTAIHASGSAEISTYRREVAAHVGGSFSIPSPLSSSTAYVYKQLVDHPPITASDVEQFTVRLTGFTATAKLGVPIVHIENDTPSR